jgi:hypothetical protein
MMPPCKAVTCRRTPKVNSTDPIGDSDKVQKKELGVDHQDPTLRSIDPPPQSKDWPHAPVHRLGDAGAYMVT